MQHVMVLLHISWLLVILANLYFTIVIGYIHSEISIKSGKDEGTSCCACGGGGGGTGGTGTVGEVVIAYPIG